jgi:hypothetical protein
MRAAVAAARNVPEPGDDLAARRFLYEHGERIFHEAVALAFAWSGGDMDEHAHLHGLPQRWQPPRFPLSGRDVLGAGASPGPAVGDLLREVEAWWIAQDFVPGEAVLRARLQAMIAAAQ